MPDAEPDTRDSATGATQPPDETEAPVYHRVREYALRLDEGVTTRVLVEPSAPLRGQDHYDGHVATLTPTDDGLLVEVQSHKHRDLEVGSNRFEVWLRFTLPDPGAPFPTEPIPVEMASRPADNHHDPLEYEHEGHLVGAGILEMLTIESATDGTGVSTDG